MRSVLFVLGLAACGGDPDYCEKEDDLADVCEDDVDEVTDDERSTCDAALVKCPAEDQQVLVDTLACVEALGAYECDADPDADAVADCLAPRVDLSDTCKAAFGLPITPPGPVLVTDLFEQTMITPVDILLVIDPHWDALATLEDAFGPTWELLLLADPSWQIGVLDATETGSKTGLITKTWGSWPPPRDPFNVGAPGTAEPRFREITYTALELRREAQQNEDFLRSGASLYVIYLGAAPDGSDTDPIGQAGFDEWFAELLPSSERRLAAITDSDHADYWQERVKGASVFEVGGLTRAVKSAVLEATGLETTFRLSEEPAAPPATIELIYREHATVLTLEEDYTYDEASRWLTLTGPVPRPGSTLRVIYPPVGSTPTTSTSTGE